MTNGHAFENDIRKFLSDVGFEDVPPWGEKYSEFFLGRQEIDAFGRQGNLYVVVDAKTKSSDDRKSKGMQKVIRIIEGYKKDVIDDIKNTFGIKHGFRTAIFVLWTKGIRLTNEHVQIAKKEGVALRDSIDLKYYNNALNQLELPNVIRNNFLKDLELQLGASDIFQENPPIEVDAIKTTIGNKKLYTFALDIQNLLKFAYVFRVETSNISASYQRLLKRRKIQNLFTFLAEKNGYFPNNIIVTTNEDLDFPEDDPSKLVDLGKLHLPDKAAYLEILDGQHRLYGFSKLKNKETRHLYVTLVKDLNETEKANLFVTINKTQTKVPAYLLWDLYEVVDPQKRGLISKYVKELNKHKPLKDLVKLPRVRSEKAYLSFPSICFVAENEIFKRFKRKKDIVAITRAFFEEIYEESYLKEDWKMGVESKGRRGFLCTNSGISIQFMLLNRILKKAGIPLVHQIGEWKLNLKTWVARPMRTYLSKRAESEEKEDPLGYLRAENASFAARNRTVIEILEESPILKLKEKMFVGEEIDER